MTGRFVVSGFAVLLLLLPGGTGSPPRCAPGNAGLALPPGFCALLVGEQLGPVRHLVVAPNGDIFASVSGRNGGVLVLRDSNNDGRADVIRRFGPGGGTGIALAGGYLYFATDDAIYRWPWQTGQLEPDGPQQTIARDLPHRGDHGSKSIALGPDGALYVNIGSASNSCQRQNRAGRSPGIDPCTELETRAGIWRFEADRPGQTQADGVHWATGMRNTVALAWDSVTGALYGAIHGRDQLGQNWGFNDRDNAEKPGEEFVRIRRGTDVGWPYCYYDPVTRAKVLAPEYGGNGREVGRCAQKQLPLIGFPGHWAPDGLVFYHGTQFPPSYRGGAFLAFHGSWNRAPLPQAGYRVVFVPFEEGAPPGGYQTFATGSGGPTSIRPTGLAVGPDGSLYLAADRDQRIWRILYQPGEGS